MWPPKRAHRARKLLVVGMTDYQAYERLPDALAHEYRHHELHVMDPMAHRRVFVSRGGSVVRSHRSGIGDRYTLEGIYDIIIMDWRVIQWVHTDELASFLDRHLVYNGCVFLRELADVELDVNHVECEMCDVGTPNTVAIYDPHGQPLFAVSRTPPMSIGQLIRCMGYSADEIALIGPSGVLQETTLLDALDARRIGGVQMARRGVHLLSSSRVFSALRSKGYTCEHIESYPLQHHAERARGSTRCVRSRIRHGRE